MACRQPALPVIAVDPYHPARRGPWLKRKGASVACMPSTPMTRLVRCVCAAIVAAESNHRSTVRTFNALSGMPETTTVEATFVFADIAGFTALTALPCDPVCRMAVDPERSAGRLTYEDTA